MMKYIFRHTIIVPLFVFLIVGSLAGFASAISADQIEVENDSDTTIGQLQPIHPHAFNYYVDGLVYDGLGDYSNAANMFKRSLQFHPNSYQIRFSLADSYYKLRKFEDVIKVLEVITPVDEDVLSMLAASNLALGKEKDAVQSYKDMIKLNPENSTVYAYLAGFYQQRNDIDSLIWAYENIVRIRPKNERHWRELGKIYAKNGDMEKAKDAFGKSLEVVSDKTNLISYMTLSDIYIVQDQLDSALVMLKKSDEVSPGNMVINREMTMIYLRMDSLEAALPRAEIVSLLNPDDKIASRRLGLIFYGLESLDQADSVFTDLVNRGDVNFANHYYLGRIAALRKDYSIAAEEFEILTKMADTLVESWLDLGFAYRLDNRRDKEIETYLTALNHVPDSLTTKLRFALGAAYESSGHNEKAIEVFEEVIAKKPDYDQALNYLGYMLAERGERLEYALKLIEKANKLSPDNAAYLDSYVWIYYRLGEMNKALKYLEKAAELGTDAVIFEHLGDTYDAVGKKDKALNWWEKAAELAPENEKIKEKLGK